MNENTNTPNGENEDDLLTENGQAGDTDLPETPVEGEEGAPANGGEEMPSADAENSKDEHTDGGEDPARDEDSEQGEEQQTEETVEVPSDENDSAAPDLMTCILFGTSLVLAAIVVVLSVLLLRRSKKKPEIAAQSAGGISIGKLHEQGDRESQQDCFAVSPLEMASSRGLLAVVADGMGGLADGDKVSQSAVASMLDGFFSTEGAPGDILLSLTEQANRRINQLLGPANIGKSGSTLVAGLIRDGRFHYISIGDSRICLYRDGQLVQLNREHIYRNDLAIQAVNGVGSLQEAARHPKAAGLTSYLGMGHLKYVDIPAGGMTIRAGDKFILMSDGVYNALSEAELSGALAEDAPQAAEKIRAMIAQKAYRHQDNYTAVILAC